MASVAQAALTFVDLPTSGTYSGGETVATNVTGTDGATFTLTYTLGLIGNPSTPDPLTSPIFISSDGSNLGVGGGSDIANHNATIEANDGQGLSFTSLTLSAFTAGTTYTQAEYENSLSWTGFNVSAGANGGDRALVSFDGFGGTTQLIAFNSAANLASATVDGAITVTGLTEYSGSEDDLYIALNGVGSNNRFGINGLQVTYIGTAIPEPTSTALLGLGGLALIMRRRK